MGAHRAVSLVVPLAKASLQYISHVPENTFYSFAIFFPSNVIVKTSKKKPTPLQASAIATK